MKNAFKQFISIVGFAFMITLAMTFISTDEASAYNWTRTLQEGSSGSDVKRITNKGRRLGCRFPYPNIYSCRWSVWSCDKSLPSCVSKEPTD